MAHECENCGQACYCDGEDMWHSWPEEIDCSCPCWSQKTEADDDDLDDDYDEEGRYAGG